jgi:thiamine-monophosphate kinase
MPYSSMGWRSAASNISDLAAMGARPLAFLLAQGLPANIAGKAALEISKGALAACKSLNTKYVGGDTKRAKEITLAGFALGKVEGTPLMRSSARPGDIVCLAGNIGDAMCGYLALAKKKKAPAKLMNAFLKPTALVEAGLAVSKNVERAACMDVTDGLHFTCAEIAKLSNVRIDLDSMSTPISPEARKFCAKNKIHTSHLLHWGEDYALAFALSQQDFERIHKQAGLVCIGTVSKGKGLFVDGKKCADTGYDAFKS